MRSKRQTGGRIVRVATLVPCSPAVISHRAVEGGEGDTVGIFFPGKASLSWRPGYDHVNLADRQVVPVRNIVTSGRPSSRC